MDEWGAWMHWGVSGVKGMENGNVDGITLEDVSDGDEEEEDARENRTSVDDEISMDCCGLDSIVSKDMVLFIGENMRAGGKSEGHHLRAVPLAFPCAFDLELALNGSALALCT